MKHTQVRQGDVLLVRVDKLPKGANDITRDDGTVLIQYGEETGHAHRIAEPFKAKLWDAAAERFVQVLEKTQVQHEEHPPLPVDPGIYQVVIQSEETREGPQLRSWD